MNIYGQIYHQIKKAKKIVIARHVGPDPDALGSSIGLKEIILNTFKDKEVYVVGMPTSKFKFLRQILKELMVLIFVNLKIVSKLIIIHLLKKLVN